MLKPEIAQLLTEADSAYALVVAVAKRSREISESAEEGKFDLYDKPLNISIDEFGSHRYNVVYDKNNVKA